MKKKLFSQIIQDIPFEWQSNSRDFEIPISGIQFDSRLVTPGDVYVALPGINTDGHKFIKEAINREAAVIFGSQPLENWKNLQVPYLQVNNCRVALAHLSAAYFGHPARFMTVIGVTGTDGKTTTSNLLYQILKISGLKVGMISTVNAQIGDKVLDTGFHVTTPEAPAVQFYLKQMLEAGITHVVLETTSHGLAQHRVTACEFDIAVVTNITHEHLDFHGTYEAYRESKAQLFYSLSKTAIKENGNIRLAILNKDDISFNYLDESISVKKKSYSLEEMADLRAENITDYKGGSQFDVVGENIKTSVMCRLPGKYNVSNCLAAMAAAIFGLGIEPELASFGISSLVEVPGRMQLIEMGQEFKAIVDFAHTPNALLNVINSARSFTKGKIITVFGSAGLRDREKRRMMAEISAEFADISIITAEDPRTESLDLILDEMGKAAEMKNARIEDNLYLVPDRGAALIKAVQLAGPNDTILACGKGHEQSMCFGEVEYPWDEATAMRSALAKVLNFQGPKMPYLPTQDAN